MKQMIQPGVSSVIKGDTLKTLCSLTISEIRPMLIATLQKLHVDKSPYVKKIAAVALVNLFLANEIEAEDLTTLFKFLTRDVAYLRGPVAHLSR